MTDIDLDELERLLRQAKLEPRADHPTTHIGCRVCMRNEAFAIHGASLLAAAREREELRTLYKGDVTEIWNVSLKICEAGHQYAHLRHMSIRQCPRCEAKEARTRVSALEEALRDASEGFYKLAAHYGTTADDHEIIVTFALQARAMLLTPTPKETTPK